MRIVYFTHSLSSCWNHGNAHFVRGLVRALIEKGHEVSVLQPAAAWSLINLLSEGGPQATAAFEEAYPELSAKTYAEPAQAVAACAGADLVIVHEWTESAVVAAVGRARRSGGGFRLMFHDTHHRAVSEPDAMRAYDLDGYDGVLAFGEALSEVYRGWGWGRSVHTWHEAADVTRFHPPAQEPDSSGLVWIGNWGDGERSEELQTFLLEPARNAALTLDIYGVRYPAGALSLLERYGARYRGWLANVLAPQVYATAMATVHVPRRYYAAALPGIPTIRVFEALACGAPLVSAPWSDVEGLFRVQQDFLMVRSGGEMTRRLRDLKHDEDLRLSLAMSGLETIRARHTCAHRVEELFTILESLEGRPSASLEVSA